MVVVFWKFVLNIATRMYIEESYISRKCFIWDSVQNCLREPVFFYLLNLQRIKRRYQFEMTTQVQYLNN